MHGGGCWDAGRIPAYRKAKLSGAVGGVLDEGGAIEVFSYGVSASDPGTGLGKSLAVGKYGDRSS